MFHPNPWEIAEKGLGSAVAPGIAVDGTVVSIEGRSRPPRQYEPLIDTNDSTLNRSHNLPRAKYVTQAICRQPGSCQAHLGRSAPAGRTARGDWRHGDFSRAARSASSVSVRFVSVTGPSVVGRV
jgi:hypothetical protein